MSKKVIWYKLIAEALLELKTVDSRKNKDDGWNVLELIVLHLLDGSSAKEVHLLLDSYVKIIGRNLGNAINYLQEVENTPVYRVKEPGGRDVVCITIDPNYEDASKENFKRIQENARVGVESFLKQTELTCPEEFKKIQKGSEGYLKMVVR